MKISFKVVFWKTEKIKSVKYLCRCCGKEAGVNSVFCICCRQWWYHRCSGLRNVRGIQKTKTKNLEKDELEVNGGKVNGVEHFCYSRDVLDSEAGVERTVRVGVAAAWLKWWEVASLPVNHNRSLPSMY